MISASKQVIPESYVKSRIDENRLKQKIRTLKKSSYEQNAPFKCVFLWTSKQNGLWL